MTPTIRKSVLTAADKIEDKMRAVGHRQVRELKAKMALPLLNRFQMRIKIKVVFTGCNSDFWLERADGTEDARLKHLSKALDEVANPLSLGVSDQPTNRPNWQRYCVRVMERFPELVELWYLAYQLDALRNRMTMGRICPATKQRTSCIA